MALPDKTSPTEIVFRKAKDGFRWRMTRKGRIVAESGEAYVSISKLKRSLAMLILSLKRDDFQVFEETKALKKVKKVGFARNAAD